MATAMENFTHLLEVNHTRVLLGFFICIKGLKSSLGDLGNFLDLPLEDELKSLLAKLGL